MDKQSTKNNQKILKQYENQRLLKVWWQKQRIHDGKYKQAHTNTDSHYVKDDFTDLWRCTVTMWADPLILLEWSAIWKNKIQISSVNHKQISTRWVKGLDMKAIC